VDGYVDRAQLPDIEGEVIAVMAPHAGHIYSGPVAGYAFATLRDLEPEIVAVISPMHQPYSQALLTTAHQAYNTPLGTVPVDAVALETLDTHLEGILGYRLARIKNDAEHSLEIELPFLQCVLQNDFRLLPVMVRDQTSRTARGLGTALAKTLGERSSILIASTDLSHFYSQTVAEKLDAEVLRQVEAFDPEGVLRVETEGKGFACGRGALAAVLWAAKGLGANSSQVLNYATSGNVTGDYNQVVGYAAAVITRRTES
jgi:AmmeMemoRadiSam system protein B